MKELLFVSEGLTREAHHRVDFVFRCEGISEHIQEISQPDDNQCGTEWLTIEELNNKLIYPNTLFNQLCAYLNKQPHSVYLGEDRD